MLPEAGDDLEETLDLRLAQGRCRLVEDEQPGVERQRLRDLGELLLPDPERADLAVRVDPEPERIEQVARICHHLDRKSTRLNSSHVKISYAVFCLKKK